MKVARIPIPTTLMMIIDVFSFLPMDLLLLVAFTSTLPVVFVIEIFCFAISNHTIQFLGVSTGQVRDQTAEVGIGIAIASWSCLRLHHGPIKERGRRKEVHYHPHWRANT